MLDEILWTERYRPHRIADLILPDELKKTFQDFVDTGSVPNLLFSGSAGLGKTSAARALMDDLDADFKFINGSLNLGIDILRNDITEYASSISFSGNRKYIIIDEADKLSPAVQDGLRAFIEKFSNNAGFILTCNHHHRITDALKSRCPLVEFSISSKDKEKLCAKFFKSLCGILDTENVKYEKKSLVHLINKFSPDWRRIIGECQKYAASGEINSGILTDFKKKSIEELIDHMKEKSLTKVRKWLCDNSDMDSCEFYRSFYDESYSLFKPSYVPQVIVFLAQYQYQAFFVADNEINNAAFCVEVMAGAEWC